MKTLSIFSAALLAAASASALDIVKNGVPQAEIVVAENANNGIRAAAKDLQDHIRKMSGAELKIVNAPAGPVKNRIYVGESEFTKKLGYQLPKFNNSGLDILVKDDYAVLAGPSTIYPVKPRYSRENQEEFWKFMGEKYSTNFFDTSSRPNVVLKFAVNDDIGEWHAVSEFLEQLGVRFYAPYKDGTVIPQKKDIVLKPGRITKEAAYGRREYTYYNAMTTDAEGISWLKRMKCGVRSSIVYNHTTRALICHPDTRKKHPNWYAEETPGKLYDGAMGQGGVPRFTDPEFQKACIDWANKLLDANPNLSAVTLGAPDGGNPWDWRDQQKYTRKGITANQAYANMLWDFHVAVADGIKARHPGKYLIWWCQYNDSVPTNVDPKHVPDNILVPSLVSPSTLVLSSVYSSKLRALEKKRKAFHCTGKSPAWEHWLFYRKAFSPRYPIFFGKALQKWRKAVRNYSDGAFMELSPEWQASGKSQGNGMRIAEVPLVHLMLYINNKLFWDPDLDLKALLDEYYTLWFGPAAGEMKKFHEFAEEVWARDESRSVTESSGFLKEKDVPEYFRLLAEAKAKTRPGTIYCKRIEDMEKGYASLRKLFPSLKRTGPVIRAYTVSDKTPLDGNLGKYKHGWMTMVDAGTGEEIRRNMTQAVISLSKDRSKVFVAVRCHESNMDKIVAKCKSKDDRAIFEDDLVEIYLDTPERSYFKVCVNANGAVWDETTDISIINRDTLPILWDPGTQAVVRRYPDRWEAEIMIPAKDFGKLGPTKEYPWGVNVCRTRISTRGYNKQKCSSIAPVGDGGYRNQKCWARMWVR